MKQSICLNNQTAGNLIRYLQEFPADAKVTIWHSYKEYDCVICCNDKHQKEENKAQLMLGEFIQIA